MRPTDDGPSEMDIFLGDLNRESYLALVKRQKQYKIISHSEGLLKFSDVSSWAQRTTVSDVISLVTTSRPLRKGGMHDLKLEMKNAARYS
jgi:hypothetical protein